MPFQFLGMFLLRLSYPVSEHSSLATTYYHSKTKPATKTTKTAKMPKGKHLADMMDNEVCRDLYHAVKAAGNNIDYDELARRYGSNKRAA